MAEQVQLRLGEPQLPADRQRELLDAAGVAGGIRVAGVDRGRERLHRSGRSLLQQSVRHLEGDVLGLDRLRCLAELLGGAVRVLQVRLLRLPHQQERDREDRQGEQVDRLIRERHHAADEAVHDVVRQQPRELLLEDAPPAFVALQRECQRDEAHVDDEVARAGEQAERGDREPVRGSVREEEAELEDAGGRQRCEGQGADVEEHVVERLPARAPIDGDAGDRQRKRGTPAEERRRRQTADGAHRQHGGALVGLEG